MQNALNASHKELCKVIQEETLKIIYTVKCMDAIWQNMQGTSFLIGFFFQILNWIMTRSGNVSEVYHKRIAKSLNLLYDTFFTRANKT